MKNKLILIFISILLFSNIYCQNSDLINQELLFKKWDAMWICHPEHNGNKTGVYLFRKQVDLKETPDKFIVHITADNRYKFYVNGEMVCFGPARGELTNWYFESIDISSYLNKGKNVICATVWNYRWKSPPAQITKRTGLIVQGNTSKESLINTNNTWKVFHDIGNTTHIVKGLYAYMMGASEKLDFNKHPSGWKNLNFDYQEWSNAKELYNGVPARGIGYGELPSYILYPREIPLMEYKKQAFKEIRAVIGIDSADEIIQNKNLIIPANSNVKIILDQKQLTTAYSHLKFTGGKDSEIKITYAESLFVPREDSPYSTTKNQEKGDRNIIEGKEFIGNYDIVIADGGNNRIFEPNWWRVFRYVQLEINTKSYPLTLQEFNSHLTGYPFEKKSSFSSNISSHSKIWNTSWHTQRLCAGETFLDAYYEQLQYVGDTRIHSLISFYMSGDSLLWKKSINDFYNARASFGLIKSSAPSRSTLFMPTYSLLWINMVQDYHRHCNDSKFVEKMLPAIIENLNWFEERLDTNGLLTNLEMWNYVDWVNDDSWNYGVPPNDSNGHSSIINMLYVYSLQAASELMRDFGYTLRNKEYDKLAEKVKSRVLEKFWDEKRQLIADNSEKKVFSQHAQIIAILIDLLPENKQKSLFLKFHNNEALIQCSFYFKFYEFEAMKKVGLGELYIESLKPWHEMLELGLTTFAETPEPTRSDCHAWSASPGYHFLSLVCGIEPLSNGFNKIKFAPNFGKLKIIECVMPHKFGAIKMSLTKTNNDNIEGNIFLPVGLSGKFHWKDKVIDLTEGDNTFKI
jgi:hypothetical protein